MTRKPPDLEPTRRALHGVAELVLAGPQYRATGTIRLGAVPDGFATTKAEPTVLVENGNLAGAHGSVPIDGRSCVELAAVAGVDVGRPERLYEGGSGVAPGDLLTIDTDAAAVITNGFDTGHAALKVFAPDIRAVLWPEHFDLSVVIDEVTYGVSAGDEYVGEPYAYVSQGNHREDPFFNQPFGAARSVHELGNADAVVAFFNEGRRGTAAP